MSISSPMGTCARFRLDKMSVVSESGDVVGAWHPDQSRIEWSWATLGVDPSLIEMARKEAQLWDQWAGQEELGDVSISSDKDRFSIGGWLKRFPNIHGAVETAGISLNLRGKVVLDVGGSGKDMAYWLRERPARIDQVEVSPRSQFLCRSRVKSGIDPDTGERIPIYYHTIPAESLPFDDASFDFVFSRSTLHHCRRPEVFQELVRVMKPGAILLFVEPHLSDPVHWLMRTRRKLLRRDRGTDNPLRVVEMQLLDQLLSSGSDSVRFYAKSLLAHLSPVRRAGGWTRASRAFATNVAFAGTKRHI